MPSRFALPLYQAMTFSSGSDAIFLRLSSWRFFLAPEPRHKNTYPAVKPDHAVYACVFLTDNAIIKSTFFKNRKPVLSHPAAQTRLRKPTFRNFIFGNRLLKSFYARHGYRLFSNSRIAILVNFSMIDVRHENCQNSTVWQKHKHVHKQFHAKIAAWQWKPDPHL